MSVDDHRDLVTAVLGVEGVVEAAIERGDDNDDLGSLRLQLVPGADEVAVAGAVNQLLRARFGLGVDTDRVRVLDERAQERSGRSFSAGGDGQVTGPGDYPPSRSEEVERRTDDEDDGYDEAEDREGDGPHRELDEHPEEPATSDALAPVQADTPLAAVRSTSMPRVQMARPGRLTIQRVQMVNANLGVIATVELGLDGAIFKGMAEGAAAVSSVHRSVAMATLRAVEEVVRSRARFEVEHLEVTVAGHERTALVVITMVTSSGSERLSGASLVREDVRQAVVRSVLAAVNRRLEPMLDQA